MITDYMLYYLRPVGRLWYWVTTGTTIRLGTLIS